MISGTRINGRVARLVGRSSGFDARRRSLYPVKAMAPRCPDEVLPELEREQARLRDLDREREEAQRRVEALQREAQAPAPAADAAAPMSPADRIRLFRSLFRGRADVFPLRWKTGNGYSPACSNLWAKGICGRPKTKCGACAHRAFIPVSDEVVEDHLKGHHVIGVYPMLPDEACWFVAADFDEESWRDDVHAFALTGRSMGMGVEIERSRSGNGAHAWIFFAAPVPAATARNVASFVLTEATARRSQLSMGSHDRLFPAQDRMPEGGFGSLIALPLQRKPRDDGNSVFVDDDFRPFDNQWQHLAAVRRLPPETAAALSREAATSGCILGVQVPEVEDDTTPWLRLPSGQMPARRIDEPLPAQVRAVLAQRLFVERAGVPAALLNRVKRIAAFDNPEYHRRDRMRLSVRRTPRIIFRAKEHTDSVSIPRACVPEVEKLLHTHGVELVVDDQRQRGQPLDVNFRGALTPVQDAAGRALLAHDTGVFVAPPGIGKTVLATWMIAQRRSNTLVLVHLVPLLEQWVTQLATFLGLDESEIGRIGHGKRAPNGRLDVAMVQSLRKGSAVENIVADYGHVVVDECHHASAPTVERVLDGARARYFLGLTATPLRRDGHYPIAEMQLGPARFTVDRRSERAQRPFDHRLVVRETAVDPGPDDETIQNAYARLVSDEARNRLILDDVRAAVRQGRSPLLLTCRTEHLDFFARRLHGFVRNIVVLRGRMSDRTRRERREQLAGIAEGDERLVLATGQFVGEGFDDPRLDTLFLALPVGWKGTLAQYAGRIHRAHPGKREVRIHDYVDANVPVLLRMFERRLRGYRAMGYARDEAPLGFTPPPTDAPLVESSVEYDPEELRHFEEDD